MNKLLLFFTFFCLSSYGQTLSVTPDGLRSSDEIEKPFVVINLEGKSAKELYDATIRYIHKIYQDPEHVIKGNIPNEYLKFSTHADQFITIKNSFVNTPFSVDYTCEVSFKDGKIKFEILALDIYEKGNFRLFFKGKGAFSGYYIYNTKNELKRQDAKDQIESYFNTQIAYFKQQLTDNLADSKW